MPDRYPPSVLAAATAAIRDELKSSREVEPDRLARAALEAAAPMLAEATLAPLIKRHAPIASEWGGSYCGTCWVKGGSRAASPCGELLAIAAMLPADASEVPGDG
jgi:hypothetical protein